MPFCWGAQPHNGLVYFNDMNTGVWITRLAKSTSLIGREPLTDVDASGLRSDVDCRHDL